MSSRQIYLTTLLTSSIGNGTAITAAPSVPDLHHFRGSYGGKDIMPLYRDAETTQPNITGDLIRQLESTLSIKISPEDLMAYITGIMGSPAYTGTFEEELATPGPRVPITKDADLFQKVSSVGRKVIAYQTYGYRFADAILATPGRIPQGTAQLTTSIPDTPEKYPEKPSDIKYNPDTRELSVGEGVVSFVAPEVWNYEVSGFRPVKSWIGYRVKNRAGKKSSPLDDIRPETWDWEMTQGLLQLLWAIEGVIALESEQAGLLERVLAGGIFRESELPKPTEDERKAPIIGVEIQPKLL